MCKKLRWKLISSRKYGNYRQRPGPLYIFYTYNIWKSQLLLLAHHLYLLQGRVWFKGLVPSTARQLRAKRGVVATSVPHVTQMFIFPLGGELTIGAVS